MKIKILKKRIAKKKNFFIKDYLIRLKNNKVNPAIITA